MNENEFGPLLDEYTAIVASERNRKNRDYWDNWNERFLIERWRGRSNRQVNGPFTMALDISGYGPMLEFSCASFYSDPAVNLREQLRYAIWEYEHLPGNRYFENAVFGSFGSVFEAAMFGADISYPEGQAPWYDEKAPVFKKKEDLLNIQPFDFYTTGLCPEAIRFYEHHKSRVEGYDIEAMFPITIRSPFSTAIMLRGFENLLIDIYDDREFFKDLMAAITGSLKEFSVARAAYLGEAEPFGLLFNDEISTPVISDEIYRELILPYEIELAEHWGGVRYWHSCGKTEEFYESVKSIPNLQMMHIGPWSDISKAAEVFGPTDISLDICVNSVRDMYEKTEEEMRTHLAEIKKQCEGRVKYAVRCDGIAIMGGKEHCLKKIGEWGRAAADVFGTEAE
jgi:uroporphyrinogen-III decarboxylase